MRRLKLYDFPRSSASYRVRIACNLKGVEYEKVLVNFRDDAQRSPEYLKLNPSGLLPFLDLGGGHGLSQSLAILRYLDRVHPEAPLFPKSAKDECVVWEMALMIACDVHPLNNLRVLNYLKHELGVNDNARNAWYSHWIQLGFEALEAKVCERGSRFCYGDRVTAVDVCLVPQLYNARRFKVPLDDFPRLVAVDAHLNKQKAFSDARPD